jgi:hypothetical protein
VALAKTAAIWRSPSIGKPAPRSAISQAVWNRPRWSPQLHAASSMRDDGDLAEARDDPDLGSRYNGRSFSRLSAVPQARNMLARGLYISRCALREHTAQGFSICFQSFTLTHGRGLDSPTLSQIIATVTSAPGTPRSGSDSRWAQARTRERTRMAQAPQLTGWQEDNLVAICAIGESDLEKAVIELEGGELLISRSAIQNLMIKFVGAERGPELSKFVFGIVLGLREDSSAPANMLSRISEIVERRADDDQRFAGWEACRPLLARLLESKSIRLAAKALDVSYDFERVYQSGRFLTTLRPIFNDPRDTILGATVVQTLRLEFLSISGDVSSLSVALDKADIEQLRRSCDEALRKSEVTYNQSSGPWKLPTLMPGEDLL